jgi:hypothetical protein
MATDERCDSLPRQNHKSIDFHIRVIRNADDHSASLKLAKHIDEIQIPVLAGSSQAILNDRLLSCCGRLET